MGYGWREQATGLSQFSCWQFRDIFQVYFLI